MRLRTALGGLVALGFVIVSTVMAARFGWQLGASEPDRILYATAGGLADILKALLPLFIVAAWFAGHYVRAIVAALVFVIFTAYSLTASFGLAAIQRADKIGTHNVAAVTLKDRRADLERLSTQRSALGNVRPAGAIEADIAAAKLDRSWASSSQCTDATAIKSRALCQSIQRLEAELATAHTADVLDSKVAAARARLDAVDVTAATVEADPQAAAISRLTGQGEEIVRTALHALIAIILELGSGLGFYLVFGHHGRREKGHDAPAAPGAVISPAHPALTARAMALAPTVTVEGPADAIERFVLERLRPVHGARVAASDLFAAYEQWCDDQGLEPVSATVFGRVVPWRKSRNGGRVWYVDCALPGSALRALRVAVDNGPAAATG